MSTNIYNPRYTIEDAQYAITNLVEIFDYLGLGDPFGAGRAREAILANFLGHTLGDDLQGADAYDNSGNIYEYKTTLASCGVAGRYDVSTQPTWQDQVDYLREDKIANNAYHYYATFTPKMELVSVFEIDGDTVLDLLLPKLQKKFFQDKTNLKVQGLHATLSAKDIRTFGNKLK